MRCVIWQFPIYIALERSTTFRKLCGFAVVYTLFVTTLCASAIGQSDAALAGRISQWWSGKAKKYLIITASNPHSDEFPPITFVDQDAVEMKTFFETLGYHPLQDPITGDNANYNNVHSALESIHHGHTENETIVVYFSGHGHFGPADQDALLELNGSEMHVTDWVRIARGAKSPDQPPSYKGQLIFILDACDSGNAVWRTALTPAELQLPTIILASSTVHEKSLQRLDSNMSAFSSVLRQAVTTDWKQADENHDGFLEYRELKDYAERSLYTLHKDGKIQAEMHPVGDTDQHLFVQYDSSQDNDSNTYPHWEFVTKTVVAETLSDSGSVLSQRGGAFIGPTIPPSLSAIASRIPEDASLPDLSLGYKALALGKFTEALTRFRDAKMKHSESPYDIAEANIGIARTKLFAGDHKNAGLYYDSARAYFGDERPSLLAEAGVNAALSGDLEKSNQYLTYAYWLTTKDIEDSPTSRSSVVSEVPHPFRVITRTEAKRLPELASSLRILQSLAVLSARQQPNGADQLVQQSLSVSASVATSQAPGAQRTAALAFANAAEIKETRGDSKGALSLYKRADDLFGKVDDVSTEYSTMLDNYAQSLKQSNKPNMAMEKSHKAEQIQSLSK